jgi:hypothetical protein
MTQVVASNTEKVTPEAACAAYIDLKGCTLLQAFRNKDNYIHLPMIEDHEEILRDLLDPELLKTIKHALRTLNDYLFDDENANFNPQAAEELRLRYLVDGELLTDMEEYPGSPMFVFTTPVGKFVIG